MPPKGDARVLFRHSLPSPPKTPSNPQNACVAEQHTLHSGRGRLKTDAANSRVCRPKATHAFCSALPSRHLRKPMPTRKARALRSNTPYTTLEAV
ncbi:hypothetical protein [Kingella potus]|uniref:hypothetical protein n=1 Tax=Kingella potus TaxID=265175 RepID=UPI001FD0C35B|nr:hypothetical protein [Kingella potus]UOP01478.1 hypothetical protein LVJ84_04605 [Kingella potus]